MFYFIINPTSGNGKAAKTWFKIEDYLKGHEIDYKWAKTKVKADGVKLAEQAIKAGNKQLVSLGGDGHHHDVINGIMLATDEKALGIKLGIITSGTGNDFIRSANLEKDPIKALEIILADKTKSIDIGKVIYGEKKALAYFHNFAGFGFDSFVVERADWLKKYGSIAYSLGALYYIFSYQNQKMLANFLDFDTFSPKTRNFEN